MRAQSKEVHEEQIDLREIVMLFWRGKYEILFAALIFGIVGIIYSFSLPNQYESKVLLSEKSASGGASQLGRLASQFSGLGGLGGLGGTDDSQETVVVLEIFKSYEFFKSRVYENVVVELMAADSWDAKTGELNLNLEVYDPDREEWLNNQDTKRSLKPTELEAYRKFVEQVSLVRLENGLIALSVSHISPHVAEKWANLLVASINSQMREKRTSEARLSIEFLNEQMGRTSLISMKDILSSLLEQQTKNLMLASASDESYFEVIEPPFLADQRYTPNRLLIALLSALFGASVGVVYTFLNSYWRLDERQKN